MHRNELKKPMYYLAIDSHPAICRSDLEKVRVLALVTSIGIQAIIPKMINPKCPGLD